MFSCKQLVCCGVVVCCCPWPDVLLPFCRAVMLLSSAQFLSGNDMVAADDRRHDQAVLAPAAVAMSVRDLHAQVSAIVKGNPETAEAPIPSPKWLALQFLPSNRFNRTAASHTARLPLRFVAFPSFSFPGLTLLVTCSFHIQKRNLRKVHEDSHYCLALYRYLRSMTVWLIKAGIKCRLAALDDKASIGIGEPRTCPCPF
jgi:hypothetical protein